MPRYYEFDVTIQDIEPRIWRRFFLRTTSTFPLWSGRPASYLTGPPQIRACAIDALGSLDYRFASRICRDRGRSLGGGNGCLQSRLLNCSQLNWAR